MTLYRRVTPVEAMQVPDGGPEVEPFLNWLADQGCIAEWVNRSDDPAYDGELPILHELRVAAHVRVRRYDMGDEWTVRAGWWIAFDGNGNQFSTYADTDDPGRRFRDLYQPLPEGATE